MTVNVAVIGGGTVSENRLSAARESNRSQLRAVCDLEERRATSVARMGSLPTRMSTNC